MSGGVAIYTEQNEKVPEHVLGWAFRQRCMGDLAATALLSCYELELRDTTKHPIQHQQTSCHH